MYKTFQLASIECAFKQTWGEKGFVSDVYQKQYNYLEHQCEKKNHTQMPISKFIF